MSLLDEITGGDIVEMINLLPDKWRNKVLELYAQAYEWRERLAGAKMPIRALIANIIGHNVVAVFKTMQKDEAVPKIRAITLEFLKEIFDLGDEWLPKWA